MGEGIGKQKISREFSSGGVVFRKFQISNFKFQIKWLITRSNPSKEYPQNVWRLPKGWIDKGETIEEAAIREVKEEGGIEAQIIKKIGSLKYFYFAPDKGRVLKFVTFYLMKWQRDLPEGFGSETSEIAWLPFKEAYKKLSFPGEKQMLKRAKGML